MPKNRGTCGIAVLKSTVKSDGTGTVEKWYRGAVVVPWYRATLVCSAEAADYTSMLIT